MHEEKPNGHFHPITDADWERQLRLARATPNLLSAQIKMKLNPVNQTPGFPKEKDKTMLDYKKNDPENEPPYYNTYAPNGVMIGCLYQEVDGFYYFQPIPRGGCWDAAYLHDIAHKLDALNEAWKQKVESMGVKTE